MVREIIRSEYQDIARQLPLSIYQIDTHRQLETVLRYYKHKYKFDTHLVGDVSHVTFAQNTATNSFDFKPLLDEITAIQQKYKDVDAIRVPIIIGQTGKAKLLGFSHILPLIYIKEKGREGLFINDSIGFLFHKENFIKEMNQRGLPVYSNFFGSQVDKFGCLNYTLAFIRDCCGKNAKNEDYIPDLLESLETHSEKVKVYQTTETADAPTFFNMTAYLDKLLKAAQSKNFIEKHRMDSEKNRPFHKNFTFELFRERHQRTVLYKQLGSSTKSPEVKNVNLYLAYRSLKVTAIFAIANYAEEIQKRFGDEKLYDEFIQYYKENRTQKIPKNAMYIDEAEPTYREIDQLGEAFIRKVESNRLNPALSEPPAPAQQRTRFSL